MKIALGLEYPLGMRGGVSVLVGKLIEGISPIYQIVLVSPDLAGFRPTGVAQHVHWDPAAVCGQVSRQLAEQLVELGVSVAHLHMGGNYGWGSRRPGQSPFPFLKQRGICGVSTIHNAIAITSGYCGPNRPAWFKWGLLPLAWLGKMDVLRNIETEIVVSRAAMRRVRRWYWPMRSRFRCVYHSRLPVSPPSISTGEREPLVLAVGSIALHKGQHTLAAAFARVAAAHPEWKLALIGEGSRDGCLEQVQQIIATHQLQDRVLLLGRQDDAAEYMRRAAIFVQPSSIEGLPLALQEAMFYGCTSIATSISGNMELIDDERSGLLVRPFDSGMLGAALGRCMSDAVLRQALGAAASAAIAEKKMNAATMIEQHIALYQSLSRDRSGAPGVEGGSLTKPKSIGHPAGPRQETHAASHL